MTLNLNGNVQNIPSVSIIDNGVNVADVTVDIPSWRNRNTEVKTIRKYLQARNGNFDRGLWQPPLVAQLPNGERYLFDGDHRRHLWKLAYPQKTKMPAQIIPVKNEQEISRLFVVANRDGRKGLLPEEVFVHEVLSGDEEAVKTRDNLEYCGLRVSLGTGEAGTVIGDPDGPEIKITGFKRARKMYGIQKVKKAVSLIRQVWPELNKRLDVEFVGGLACLYKMVPAFSDDKGSVVLLNFMIDSQALFKKSEKVATHFKKEGGGSFGDYASRSIALGILRELKGWARDEGQITKYAWSKYYREPLENLENLVKASDQ